MRIELDLKTGAVILLGLIVVLYVVVPFVLARAEVVALVRDCSPGPGVGSGTTVLDQDIACTIATLIVVSVSGVFAILFLSIRK